MFRKVLIANRGEIALRILRACRDLGIRSVVAYSEADRDTLAVRLSDEAVCIGPAPAARSYNNIPAIISAATLTGCDALHPGYGFLAESPSLPEVCRACNITYIGPREDVIAQMGDKAAARRSMKRAGIPIMPGTEDPITDPQQAREAARLIGYPVLIKAVAGGGGRGMRIARDERELLASLSVAQSEARTAFGNGAVYIERYLEAPRHVEVQILADEHGHVLAIGERDCSLQRRYQKVMEESPAPLISSKLRDNLLKAAVKGAKAIGYTNAGTFEFLVGDDDKFYFTETNTRIQVEHPVTELVTGIDLVKWQIRIAAGEPLSFSQKQIRPRGHAVEVRITAEDPRADFQPSAGPITDVILPGGPGIRVDSHLYPGYVMPPFYDSLLAKIIAWGETRGEALERLRRALAETVIAGIETTIEFHEHLLADELVNQGQVSTTYVAHLMESFRALPIATAVSPAGD